MAIQIPNLGTGDGLTGDNELVIRQKYNDNFSNTTHAASKLVGTATGQIPLTQDVYKAAYSRYDGIFETGATTTLNTFASGTRYLVKSVAVTPELHALLNDSYYYIETLYTYESSGAQALIQRAHCYTKGGATASRTKSYGEVWTEWKLSTTSTHTYTTTTALGANVVVDSTGLLMRSTSSERYKDIIADLTLDDVTYANAMQIAPIVYRSTADADNPLHHYYSFSAEKLGAFDPAFTLWRDTEMVTDADGNTTEQPLAEKQAEGLNINALLAFNHAIAIKQDVLIKALAARIAALEAKGA